MPGKTYALLIGIDRSECDGLRPLEFAVADVRAFASVLQQRLGAARDHCRLLTNPVQDSHGLPRRGEILRQLDHFSHAPMTAEDTFIFYFAGHGFSLGKEEDANTFLLAADSDHGSHDLLKATAITLDELKTFLRKITAGQQLVILDACRNDPTTGSRSLDDNGCDDVVTRDIVALAKPEKRAASAAPVRRSVLSACWTGGRSHEYRDKQHSWFCYHLLEAIKNHAGTELALTRDWVDSMATRMTHAAWQVLPRAAGQLPHLVIDGGDAISLRLFSASTARTPSISWVRGWAMAAAFYLATIIPVQTVALIGLRAGAAMATARGWIQLKSDVVHLATLIFALAVAWWIAQGLALLLGWARRGGGSIPGQVVAYFAGQRHPGTSTGAETG